MSWVAKKLEFMQNAFTEACELGCSVDMTEILDDDKEERILNINNDHLHYLCLHDKPTILERVIDDYNVDFSNDDGFTLITCCNQGKRACLEVLLSCETIDTNKVCRESLDDGTPLCHAIAGGHPEIVERLLSLTGSQKVDMSDAAIKHCIAFIEKNHFFNIDDIEGAKKVFFRNKLVKKYLERQKE